MTGWKKGALAVAALFLAAVVVLRVVGLNPQDTRPGLWLSGEAVSGPITDWSFTDDAEEIFVETRTRIGVRHSVTTYCATFEGELYLFSVYYDGGTFPEERAWNRNVTRDPRVRLEIDGRLYDGTLTHVTDAATRSAVHEAFIAKYPEWTSPGLQDVHVLRVDP